MSAGEEVIMNAAVVGICVGLLVYILINVAGLKLP